MENESVPHTRVGIYISGRDEASLTASEKNCRRVAAELLGNETEPVSVWRDIVGERDADRTGQEAMLQAAENEQFNVLVTQSPYHISRDLGEFIEIEDRLAGIRIVFADGCPDGSTEGALTVRTASYRDLLEAQDTGKRTRRGRTGTTRQGLKAVGSPPPYGYRLDRRVNEREARYLKQIFEMADDGLTPRQIAEALNEVGITRHGKRWTGRTIWLILRNPLPAGILSAGIDQREGDRNRTGGLPPIIDMETWYRVQDKLGDPRETPSLLSGFLQCGLCGNPMVFTTSKGERIYQCLGSMPSVDSPRTCCAPPIPAQDLERRVWAFVEGLVRNPAQVISELENAGAALTPERKRQLAEQCRQIVPSLGSLNQSGKRGALRALEIRVAALKGLLGTQTRISFGPHSDGTPEAAN